MSEYSLDRFLEAQNKIYDGETMYMNAFLEIESGRKRNHWIWFIFPQQKGLGCSYNSEYYGLDGENEAKLYLSHPILGERLRAISKVLLVHKDSRNIRQIMGSSIDVTKLKTCMTLFNSISPNDVFKDVLDTYFSNR